MYKNKPLIIAKRPFWRHPIFSFGWYSICQDDIYGDDITAEGFFKPGDGGQGKFYIDHNKIHADNGGKIFNSKIRRK